MKVEKIILQTGSGSGMADITADVASAIRKLGMTEGAAVVFVPHTTAAVTINENADPSVRKDILSELEKIVPADGGYSHAEGNSAAHIKASMLGSSVIVPVSAGKPALGTWQGIFFCEFDGPRTRTAWVFGL